MNEIEKDGGQLENTLRQLQYSKYIMDFCLVT